MADESKKAMGSELGAVAGAAVGTMVAGPAGEEIGAQIGSKMGEKAAENSDNDDEQQSKSSNLSPMSDGPKPAASASEAFQEALALANRQTPPMPASKPGGDTPENINTPSMSPG